MTERFQGGQSEADDLSNDIERYLKRSEDLTKLLTQDKIEKQEAASSENETTLGGFVVGKVLMDEDMNGRSYYLLYPFDPIARFQSKLPDETTAEVTIHKPEIIYESDLEENIIPEKWDIVLAEKYSHRRGNKSLRIFKREE